MASTKTDALERCHNLEKETMKTRNIQQLGPSCRPLLLRRDQASAFLHDAGVCPSSRAYSVERFRIYLHHDRCPGAMYIS